MEMGLSFVLIEYADRGMTSNLDNINPNEFHPMISTSSLPKYNAEENLVWWLCTSIDEHKTFRGSTSDKDVVLSLLHVMKFTQVFDIAWMFRMQLLKL